jgi:CubicO group peptidase (beta-lactamase class C family)
MPHTLSHARTAAIAGLALSLLATAHAWAQDAVQPQSGARPAMTSAATAYDAVLSYARDQHTTGFLVMRDNQIIVEQNWPVAPAAGAGFRTFGTDAHGALLEDVASQQKSFMAILAGVAVDKGLLDPAKPVSAYLGAGWSKASPEQEARITVLNILEMNSGLRTDFTFEAEPGTRFAYNTPVYAVMKRVLEAAAHETIDHISHAWLTEPAAMNDTSWRDRGAAGAEIGNPLGLVTTPRDVAKLGQVVLANGVAADGRRIISAEQLRLLLTPSPTNPAYGRLWWLNGGAYTIRPATPRVEGPLIPAAPADLVAALGALGRKLYVVPSQKLIVVRMGQNPSDPDFDQQLWLRLEAALTH